MKVLSAAHFWLFSCEVYAMKDMQPQLLSLQDKHNKNVNLCLLLLYLDTLQIQLSAAQYHALESICGDIDAQFLMQHRLLRRTLKSTYQQHPHYHDVRAQLLNSELALEKFQQSLLVDALNKTVMTENLTADNLSLYLESQHLNALKQCYLGPKI